MPSVCRVVCVRIGSVIRDARCPSPNAVSSVIACRPNFPQARLDALDGLFFQRLAVADTRAGAKDQSIAVAARW